MNTDAVDATTRFCPVCQAEGKGQYPLRRTEVTGGGLNDDGTEREPFHEVHYTCPLCGQVFYDVPKGVAR